MLKREILNEVERLVEEVLEDLDLFGHNSEVYFDEGNNFCTAEAYNNSTLNIELNDMLEDLEVNLQNDPHFELDKEFVRNWVMKEGQIAFNYYDPEDVFNEIWSPNFEFGAFTFVEILQADYKQFEEVFG